MVKEWGEAVNARDWARACELSAAPRTDCEARLRRDFARADLRFDGPATNGGAMQPGEEYFGFSDHPRAVFVTAVPEDGDFRVRVEAVITR